MVLKPPGAAQTPKMTDFRPLKKFINFIGPQIAGFDLFDLSSVRVPGPVPHPGFQKQQFTRNVRLFLGGSGAGLPCPIPPTWGLPGLPGSN